MRDDFSNAVKDKLKMRASFICSNPNCRVLTLAPSGSDSNSIIYTGIAAHICAASQGGPRYDTFMTVEERSSIDNAIFLCSNCAVMIDKNNGIDFDEDLLQSWKEEHEIWIRSNLNKRIDINQNGSNVQIINNGQSAITAQVVNLNNSQIGENTNSKINHDINLYVKSDLIMNEAMFKNIEESLIENFEITFDEYYSLFNFRDFFDSFTNRYIHDEIEDKRLILIDELEKVINYIHEEYEANREAEGFFRKEEQQEIALPKPPPKSKSLFDYVFPKYEPERVVVPLPLKPKRRNWYGDLVSKYEEYRREIKIKLFI